MSPIMSTAYIALGSNLGDRKETLDQSLRSLAQVAGVTVIRSSTYHETDPVGGPAGQGKFLNAAAELHTSLSAPELLAVLLDVESQLGRVRHEHHGPRTLDLDLLLFDQDIVATPSLRVPHPRLHERAFVLKPLAEIAPLAVHPVLRSTVWDLLLRLDDATNLTGRRALVTGSTSGIGRAIALALARGGASVLVHGRRSEAKARAVADELAQLGRASGVVMGDLRSEADCQRLVADAWRHWDGLDICINNAGADTLTGEAARWPFERKLEELWAVDVRGTALIARDVGARMRTQGDGVLVNMGWDQADTGMEGDSGQLFGAVKGAVMAFTKSLALSLAPQVRVNCLAPGWIRTEWGENASPVWQQRAIREAPLARWGTPDDVARTARWLVSPAANFLTGQIIRVNGGAVRV